MIAIKKELISQELGGGRLLANTACRDTREFGPLPSVDDDDDEDTYYFVIGMIAHTVHV